MFISLLIPDRMYKVPTMYMITNEIEPGDTVFNIDSPEEEFTLSKSLHSSMNHDGTIHTIFKKMGIIVNPEECHFGPYEWKEFIWVHSAGWNDQLIENEFHVKKCDFTTNHKVKIL